MLYFRSHLARAESHRSRGDGAIIAADGAPSLLLSPGRRRQATQVTARAAAPALLSPGRLSFLNCQNLCSLGAWRMCE